MPLKTTSTNDVPAFLAMAVMNESAKLEAAGADVFISKSASPRPRHHRR